VFYVNSKFLSFYHYILLYIKIVLVCLAVDLAWGARRIDAQVRARETLRRRRDQRQLRREVPLDVPELLQLTQGMICILITACECS
jgi:hypothetical protein